MFTVTERMSMQEPSIQMVPRDFNVNISPSIFENVKENMVPKDKKLSHDSLMSSFTELLTNIEGIIILFHFLNKISGRDFNITCPIVMIKEPESHILFHITRKTTYREKTVFPEPSASVRSK